jgi:hypothetical protein
MPAHPEDELLADLAADVLPIDVARQVEAHVIGCARCSQVLSSAESISALIRQAPPEAMPPQVRARLEQALASVQQGREPQPMPRRSAGPMGAAGLPGAVGVPGSAPLAGAPPRRGARTGPQPQSRQPQNPQPPNPQHPNPQHPNPQSQNPWPQPNQPGQRPGHPSQPLRTNGSGPTGPERPQVPPRAQPPARPQNPVQPERPAAAQAHRPAELKGKGAPPAPNTSSYTVRPLQPKRDGGAFPAGDPTTLQPPVQDEGPESELTQPVRKRRSRPAGPPPETSGMTTLMRPVRDRPPGKLTRMESTQTVRVRRQALEEQKADEPSRWPRISPQIAAAVVLVMALAGGVVFWQVHGGSGSNADSGSSASSAAGGTPMLATVEETGTKYKKSTLKNQVDTLVSNRNKALSAPAASAAADSRTGTLSAQSDGESGTKSASSAAGEKDAELLTSPKALQACLKAIGQEGQQPVAVDLATYEDREAALIVLPGTNDGYDVWIVARTCQPGNDGTVAVVEVKS